MWTNDVLALISQAGARVFLLLMDADGVSAPDMNHRNNNFSRQCLLLHCFTIITVKIQMSCLLPFDNGFLFYFCRRRIPITQHHIAVCVPPQALNKFQLCIKTFCKLRVVGKCHSDTRVYRREFERVVQILLLQ
jgi:hypothetical protein